MINEAFTKVWFSGNFHNVLFSDDEMNAASDLIIGPDGTPDINTSFNYSKKNLIKSFTKSEILNSTPDERKKCKYIFALEFRGIIKYKDKKNLCLENQYCPKI